MNEQMAWHSCLSFWFMLLIFYKLEFHIYDFALFKVHYNQILLLNQFTVWLILCAMDTINSGALHWTLTVSFHVFLYLLSCPRESHWAETKRKNVWKIVQKSEMRKNRNLIYATQNDNKENVLIMGMVLVSFQTVVQSDIWCNRSSIIYWLLTVQYIHFVVWCTVNEQPYTPIEYNLNHNWIQTFERVYIYDESSWWNTHKRKMMKKSS